MVARLDDEGLALTVCEAMRPYARLVGSGAGEVVTGSVHRPVGLMLAILGRYDDACTHYDAAQEVHRRSAADLWVVRTDVDHAWTLLRRGTQADREAAALLLQRSLDASRRLGMSTVAKTIERMTPAIAKRNHADARAGGLTPRELQVAALVAKGHSNRDIAKEFVLSERTIETHVQNILTKLDFSSRVEIAAWVIRNGIAADG